MPLRETSCKIKSKDVAYNWGIAGIIFLIAGRLFGMCWHRAITKARRDRSGWVS
jgi:hypothetical protein